LSDPGLKVQVQKTKCPALINETVTVQANVKITPCVEIGTIKSYCVGRPVMGACEGTPVEECTFSVSQNICVQVPLSFAVDTLAEPAGIICGTPLSGPCGQCKDEKHDLPE
jgi:hypothetical protein